jgi:recombination protein RecA
LSTYCVIENYTHYISRAGTLIGKSSGECGFKSRPVHILKKDKYMAKVKYQPVKYKHEMTEDERDQNRQDAIAALTNRYGSDVIQQGWNKPIERIPTGIASLDLLLRQVDTTNDTAVQWGFARGHWSMVWGPGQVGKTSILLKSIAHMQRNGLDVAIIDAEHKTDPIWAAALGVDTERLLVMRPMDAEQCFDSIKVLVQDYAPDVILFDSLVAIHSHREAATSAGVERDFYDQSMGVQPRLFSECFRRITPFLGKSRTAVIFINQVRKNLGGYIVRDDYPGGNALRHNLFDAIQIRRVKSNRTATDLNALLHNHEPNHDAKLIVTKGMNESQDLNLTFYQSFGFDLIDDLANCLIETGIIPKVKAGWYSLGESTVRRKEVVQAVAARYDEWYERLMIDGRFSGKESQDAEDDDTDQ